MSLFAPMDPRGPDQRRKQLMAKLAQQHRGAAPMPAAAGRVSGMGGGTSFRGASNFRPPSTHGGNVVSSILQRLGVGGGPGQGEFSPGEGMAIGHSGGMGDPYSRTPQPITGGTPIQPYSGVGVGDPPPPMIGHSDQPGPALSAQTPDQLPALNTGATGVAAPQAVGGLIALGNGMFYDPSADKVVNGPGAGPAAGARGLYRE